MSEPLLQPESVSQYRAGDRRPDGCLSKRVDSAPDPGGWIGDFMVNYLSHGSTQVWKGDLLATADARELTNGERLPFVISLPCLNGFFHDLHTESLAEGLQRMTLGEAIARAKAEVRSREFRHTWILFGDPTTRLR